MLMSETTKPTGIDSSVTGQQSYDDFELIVQLYKEANPKVVLPRVAINIFFEAAPTVLASSDTTQLASSASLKTKKKQIPTEIIRAGIPAHLTAE